MTNAVGTLLVAVTAFGLTTSASYAASGLVDLRLAAILLIGGAAGTLVSVRLNSALVSNKAQLSRVFAVVVGMIGVVIVVQAAGRHVA